MSETMNYDDLELELRKLPGVRAAGFTEADDMLVVQVQVTSDSPGASLSQQAARIAYRHADRPVALEIVRWRTPAAPATPDAPEPLAPSTAPGPDAATPVSAAAGSDGDELPAAVAATRLPRVRLLAVLTFPDTDELEVHLTYEGRRVIGRAAASAAITGAVQATLEGLTEFAAGLDATVVWVEEVKGREGDDAAVIACGLLVADQSVLGIASGGSLIEAAARATLHALNRSLEDRLHPTA
jgi:hypothetical protein